jgi:hypothetical protein
LTSNISALYNEIAKAARTVAFQWPGIVEEEDLTQDITVKLLESPSSIDKLINEFDDRQRLNAIVQIGHRIASKERADYEVFSGNFRYSVDEVRRILEDRALHNENPELGSSWSVSDDFITGGEFEDAVLYKSSSEIDLKRGMTRLKARNPKQAAVILERYLGGEVIEQGSRRNLLDRALTALTTEMNRSFKQQQREHQGPGKRKPVSAAAAHYRSKANWDDESSEAVNRLLAQAKVSASR